MSSDVTHAKNEILCELMLYFEVPVLHHARAPITRGHEVWKSSIQERRVCVIGRKSKGRETCIQGTFTLELRGRKPICGYEIRIGRCPTGEGVPKVGIK